MISDSEWCFRRYAVVDFVDATTAARAFEFAFNSSIDRRLEIVIVDDVPTWHAGNLQVGRALIPPIAGYELWTVHDANGDVVGEFVDRDDALAYLGERLRGALD